MAFRQENLYKVYVGPAGEILIAILGQESEPADPVLMYDGGEHALLRRNRVDVVILDYVHPEARPHLQVAREATIVELNQVDGATVPRREYLAPVRLLEKLPVDFDLLMAG